MRRIMSAREQVELLTPWREAGPIARQVWARQFLADAPLQKRLLELNQRHRFAPMAPDKYAPLSDDEHQERADMLRMGTDLKHRYDSMEPMEPEELDAHRQLNGEYRNGDYRLPPEPHEMTDSQKANRFADLHGLVESPDDEMTPREQYHHDTLKPWADKHFEGISNQADQIQRHFEYYDQNGEHENGLHSLKNASIAHDPANTSMWAAQHSETPGALGTRSWDLYNAARNVSKNGPLGMDSQTGNYHFQDMQKAHNAMRAELQHTGHFRVPSTGQLSKVNPDLFAARPQDGNFINPRYNHGAEGNDYASERAYQVNCQRSTLAADAYHRGFNVEAAPNYKKVDKQFNDHDIASWYRDPQTGQGNTWQDAQDEFEGTPNSPKLWDAMTNHMSTNWGPGGRGVVAMSYKTPGGYSRHVINAHVGDDGKVNYYDPQSSENDQGDHWRTKVGYRMHGKNKSWRDSSRGLNEPGSEQLRSNLNRFASPLRFMRTDDKELSPETSQHMIDRGSASHQAITPVRKSTGLEGLYS
jgi:hypothetical protein